MSGRYSPGCTGATSFFRSRTYIRFNHLDSSLGGLAFGTDGDGNYGYYGADGSLIPFSSFKELAYIAMKYGYGTTVGVVNKDSISAGYTNKQGEYFQVETEYVKILKKGRYLLAQYFHDSSVTAQAQISTFKIQEFDADTVIQRLDVNLEWWTVTIVIAL